MLEKIKKRCGIAEGINVYNDDISVYIEDALEDRSAAAFFMLNFIGLLLFLLSGMFFL